MHRLTAAVVWLLIGSVPSSSTIEVTKDVGTPSVTVEQATSATDTELVRWALARFVGAGLEPPRVNVALHRDKEACAGHPGLFRDEPKPRIDVCGYAEFSTAARKTMLHELAHAWAHENLSGEDIEAFLASRSLVVWAGPQAPWESKGSEHAAEIISWALFDRELDLVTIPDAEPEAIQAAYRLLTGRPLPDR